MARTFLAALLIALLSWPGAPPCQEAAGPRPGPVLIVANDSKLPREEVALVSVPFAPGRRRLDDLAVPDTPTAWRVLCRWPDGSIRVAQAQVRVRLAPGQVLNLRLAEGQALTGPFRPHPGAPALGAPLGLATAVADRRGTEYWCGPAGRAELLEETALVRTVRYRGLHRNPDPARGIGRDFLSLTTYVTQFAASPILVVDLVLGNDYLGSDRPGPGPSPLGPVGLAAFDLASFGPAFLLQWARESGAGEPFLDAAGRVRQRLLEATYLGDGQCRRWRALVLAPPPECAPAERAAWENSWRAMAARPLRPLADAAAWKASGALSLYGGPAYPPADWAARTARELAAWSGAGHFGPFGSWGDIKETGTTGTPRNCPCSPEWVRAVQTSRGRLLDILVGKAWQQACRPCHMWGLRIGPDDGLYLFDGLPYSVFGGRLISPETLGRKALHDADPYAPWREGVERPWPGPHGWNAYDSEHWTTDLLFDAWIATGDWWCRDELAHLGECAMGLLRPVDHPTRWPQAARAEGWMAHSLVQVWLATGDERIKEFLSHRIREILVPAIQRDRPWRTPFIQRDYPGTGFPPDHRFYMPWQHGPLILGMLAAWRYLGEPAGLELCAAAMQAVEHARVREVRDPRFGHVAEGLRFHVPVAVGGKQVAPDVFDADPAIGIRFGDSPLGGAHAFLTLPLWLLAREEAAAPECRRLAAGFGGLLLEAHRRPPGGAWDKWSCLIPD